MPDTASGKVNLVQTEENFVGMTRDGVQMVLAHLKSGSLLVSPGSAVTEGQPVAREGYSGNSMEPHLHFEAYRDGQPISLRFEGRVLVVNDAIRLVASLAHTFALPGW